MNSVQKLAIIWMHGLGDRGDSWREIEGEVTLPNMPIKWQFPDAPVAAVTCNGGYRMTSWFDIEDIPVDENAKDYPADIQTSVDRIHKMIAALEDEGYKSHEIAVGGFSQGGAMAIQTMIRYPKPLFAAICFSGWVMLRNDIASLTQPANKATPIFWGHGQQDTTVNFSLQGLGVSVLSSAGFPVTHQTYRIPHSSCSQENRDLAAFLSAHRARSSVA